MSNQPDTSGHFSIPRIAWFMWGLGALFYFAQYLLRVVPSVIVEDLMLLFNVSASISGVLGSCFYYPYVAMQIPVGTLVDKFGVRLLLGLGALACALSAWTFAFADSVMLLLGSRFLLGLFSAAGFICALKLARTWFPASMFGFVVGITQTLGMFGAGLGGPAAHVHQHFGYPPIFIGLGTLFTLLAILALLFVKNQSNPQNTSQVEKPNHRRVLTDKFVWINALYAGLVYAPVQVFGEYWGPFFLSQTYEMSNTQASWAVSMMFLGWVIGGPIAGKVSDLIGRRKVMINSAIIGTILLAFIFFGPRLSASMVFALFFTLGFTNTGLVASYAASGELHDKASSGLSLAICNMLSIFLGGVFIFVCGALLDLISSGAVNELNNRIYTQKEILLSFGLLPLCSLLAIVFAFKMKETYER